MWMSETARREGLVNELKSKGEREEWGQEESEDRLSVVKVLFYQDSNSLFKAEIKTLKKMI